MPGRLLGGDLTRFRTITPVVFLALLPLVAWASMAFTAGTSVIAAVWPANAMILAFLIRWARTWSERVFVLASSAVVLMIASAIVEATVPMALSLTALNLAEVGLSAWFLRRVSNPMADLRAFLTFLVGPVLLVPAVVGAGAGAVYALAPPGIDPFPIWMRWFLADSLGMAIVGSFLLTIGRPFAHRPTRNEVARFVIAQGLVVAVCVQVLLLSETPALFLIAPFLVAAAMSHSQLGGITAVAIASAFAVIGWASGSGTAAVAHLASVDPIQVMQVFLASMAFTVLPISALLQRLELAAAELDERRAKAETLNQIKTQLLAQVSHEIRSPLAGVTTLAELMRDGKLGDLTPSQRETMAQIVVSGVQVSDLARDLTDAAVLQSGKASMQVSEVKVIDAIHSAVESARFRTSQFKGVIEVTHGEGCTLSVAADPLRLRQILVNLLINGAKYGGHPFLVTIGARLTDAGHIRFEVSDNGRGISAEHRARLFRDFERLGAEKTDLDGSGLGLALSQQIASLQNGQLGVEDGDLGGARFWLDLPVWTADAAPT